jgi:hypothetical protein
VPSLRTLARNEAMRVMEARELFGKIIVCP